MKRGLITLLVGIAFLCGFWTAYLIQGYLLSNGLQLSIDVKFTKPLYPLPTLKPLSPEAAKVPAPMASAPQPAPPEVSSQAIEKASSQTAGASSLLKENPRGKEEPEHDPGLQGTGGAPSPVTGCKETIRVASPVTAGGAMDTATGSQEVAASGTTEARPQANAVVDLPPAPKPSDQVLVSDTSHLEGSQVALTSTPAPAPKPQPYWSLTPGGLPAQVVVQKGDNISKLIAKHYPGQEKLGLLGPILANPEFNTEGMLYPGQVLTFPRINVTDQTVELQDQKLYALYGIYYSAASWEGDKSRLEKNQVRFLVRVSRDANGRVVHRIFMEGYETVAALKEAQDQLQTKMKPNRPEKISESSLAASATREEEAGNGAVSDGGTSQSQKSLQPSENQPDRASPTPPTAPGSKGETRLQAGEMVAAPPASERRLENVFPPEPPIQSGMSQQAMPTGFFQKIRALAKDETGSPEPSTEAGLSRPHTPGPGIGDSRIGLSYSLIQKQLAKSRIIDDIDKYSFLQNNRFEVNLVGNRSVYFDNSFLKPVGIDDQTDRLLIFDLKNKIGTFSYGMGYYYLGLDLSNIRSINDFKRLPQSNSMLGNGQQGSEIWGMQEFGPISFKAFMVGTADNLNLNPKFLRPNRLFDLNHFPMSGIQSGIASEYKMSSLPLSIGASYSRGSAETIARTTSAGSQSISFNNFSGFLYWGNSSNNLTASSSYSGIQDRLYSGRKSNFLWHEIDASLQPIPKLTINSTLALGQYNDLWSGSRTRNSIHFRHHFLQPAV